MTDAAVGQRVKALADERGVTVPQLARGLEIDPSVLYRLLRGDVKWTVDYLVKAATTLATTPAALLAPVAASATAGDTNAPTAAAGASDEAIAAAQAAGFWRGRQQALLDIMEHVADLQEKAAAMQAQAIRTQREIITHTSPTPVPESVLRQAALDHAREKQERGTARSKRAHGDPHGRAEGA